LLFLHAGSRSIYVNLFASNGIFHITPILIFGNKNVYFPWFINEINVDYCCQFQG
jgi:hypothetical protein